MAKRFALINHSSTLELCAVCEALQEGFFAMMATGDANSYQALDSLASTMHMPFVNWEAPSAHVVCFSKMSQFESAVE